MSSIILKHFYFLGSLIVGGCANIIFALILFIGPSRFFLRGTSPWVIYLSFIVATFLALGYSFFLDRKKIFSDKTILYVFYGVYTIFSVGNITLFLFLFGKSGVYIPLNSLILILLLGIPLCLFLGWIYLTLTGHILLNKKYNKKLSC